MPRLVKHEAQHPQELKAGEQSLWICMCGLSGRKPLCDGSHKRTKDEEPHKTYMYDKEKRVEV